MNEPQEELEHEMRYRAATLGLSRLGIPDNNQAGWWCTCGRWEFRARLVLNSETGNNLAAARRAHEVHVRTAARWTRADITDTRK